MFVNNHPKRKRLRQKLRSAFSEAEVILWKRLQKRRLMGLKFRRQYGIGVFVVDFYCTALRLAVEVDDSTHFWPGRPEYDQRRQEYIESQDIVVARFFSIDVIHNTDIIIDALAEICRTTPVLSAQRPKPPLLP